jgi:hypothetical protein
MSRDCRGGSLRSEFAQLFGAAVDAWSKADRRDRGERYKCSGLPCAGTKVQFDFCNNVLFGGGLSRY